MRSKPATPALNETHTDAKANNFTFFHKGLAVERGEAVDQDEHGRRRTYKGKPLFERCRGGHEGHD